MESGRCPKCRSYELTYGTQEQGFSGDTFFYYFTCKKCGFKGKEWYDTNFSGFTDEDNEDVKGGSD